MNNGDGNIPNLYLKGIKTKNLQRCKPCYLSGLVSLLVVPMKIPRHQNQRLHNLLFDSSHHHTLHT
jgi:hypothetical protein